jgi:hypothetical protein
MYINILQKLLTSAVEEDRLAPLEEVRYQTGKRMGNKVGLNMADEAW